MECEKMSTGKWISHEYPIVASCSRESLLCFLFAREVLSNQIEIGIFTAAISVNNCRQMVYIWTFLSTFYNSCVWKFEQKSRWQTWHRWLSPFVRAFHYSPCHFPNTRNRKNGTSTSNHTSFSIEYRTKLIKLKFVRFQFTEKKQNRLVPNSFYW